MTIKLNAGHIARVAFEADRALLTVLGRARESKTSWQDMKDDAKAKWIRDKGPAKSDKVRARLYYAIHLALEEKE